MKPICLFYHTMLSLNVNFKIAQAISPVWTVRTVEGLLPSVSHHVVVQMLSLVPPTEELVTNWAH